MNEYLACRLKYYDENDKVVAEVCSTDAWMAVKRLFGMPQLPERKLTFMTDEEYACPPKRVIERLSQWEEVEKQADKGKDPFAVDVELYGRIRC